ncbi:hypothetical protein Srubr_06120 [Streptomyces rubradiris]|uniref:Uncharacterized protein n=1 Tax=Streptomyces rubradiris TaxID=285531 RepID=A0ABQ3R4J1_STRRR|nr:hypothetical protein GCM10018792_25180 [Streptomyces rubradiris]GHI50766.1 hypothetical protein Srubr_06120 [Streptomyces rubradiris]
MPAPAGPADSAVLDRDRGIAAASAAFSPLRRVTRLWLGTGAPPAAASGRLVVGGRLRSKGWGSGTVPEGGDRVESAEWSAHDVVLTSGKVAR